MGLVEYLGCIVSKFNVNVFIWALPNEARELTNHPTSISILLHTFILSCQIKTSTLSLETTPPKSSNIYHIDRQTNNWREGINYG